jgi:hypothetical protein
MGMKGLPGELLLTVIASSAEPKGEVSAAIYSRPVPGVDCFAFGSQ